MNAQMQTAEACIIPRCDAHKGLRACRYRSPDLISRLSIALATPQGATGDRGPSPGGEPAPAPARAPWMGPADVRAGELQVLSRLEAVRRMKGCRPGRRPWNRGGVSCLSMRGASQNTASNQARKGPLNTMKMHLVQPWHQY